jgi:D-serine deaminase-like pyridoxal phosphate-dependent protein
LTREPAASTAPTLPGETWARYKRALGPESLPAALVDLDAFDANADRLFATTRAAKKTLRVASKSVRVPALLRRLQERGKGVVRGLMTYHARETAFLAEEGFDDFLLAYPTVHPGDAALLAKVAKSGKTVATVVDDVAQLPVLNDAAAKAETKLRAIIELDVAFRPMGMGHLGPRRSPVRDPVAVVDLATAIASHAHLEFGGLMAYEGHIAGVTDENPFTPAINGAKRLIKVLSRGEMERTRGQVVAALKAAGLPPPLFNGGGSGSLTWSGADAALTELTAGSGFMDSHLFDYYRDLQVEPATFFALQAVRRPMPGMLTCHGGGFIASGEAGKDRLPVPALPAGLTLLSLEGAGEVQTPIVVPEGVELRLGDPVFFRHAKAGELAEHFNEYLLVRGDKVETRAPTYRGMGQCFLG